MGERVRSVYTSSVGGNRAANRHSVKMSTRQAVSELVEVVSEFEERLNTGKTGPISRRLHNYNNVNTSIRYTSCGNPVPTYLRATSGVLSAACCHHEWRYSSLGHRGSAVRCVRGAGSGLRRTACAYSLLLQAVDAPKTIPHLRVPGRRMYVPWLPETFLVGDITNVMCRRSSGILRHRLCTPEPWPVHQPCDPQVRARSRRHFGWRPWDCVLLHIRAAAITVVRALW